MSATRAGANQVQLDNDCFIERVRHGRGDPVYFADGFTSTDRGWGDWEQIITRRYPTEPVYRVVWPSGKPATGVLTKIDAAFDWPWATARAAVTGALLANHIRVRGEHPVLIGHSLGGRVAAKAAYELGKEGHKVRAVHLLGAAIVRAEGWKHLERVASEGVWNYFSRNDWVIEELYWWGDPRAHWTQPVGSRGFAYAPGHGIEDVDVSEQVGDHSAYTHRVRLR